MREKATAWRGWSRFIISKQRASVTACFRGDLGVVFREPIRLNKAAEDRTDVRRRQSSENAQPGVAHSKSFLKTRTGSGLAGSAKRSFSLAGNSQEIRTPSQGRATENR
jgi:hypothetical protein